jgi:hypothetical protein
MKNYLTEWKKYKKNTLTENISSVGQQLELPLQQKETDKEKEEASKKQQELLNAQIKAKLKELENLKKTLQDIKSDKQPQQLSLPMEQNVGNAAGNPSDGAVGNKAVPYSVLDEEELTEEELEEASGCHEGLDEAGKPCNLELQYEEVEEQKQCNECRDCTMCSLLTEAKYKGKKVPLGKPMRGDVKKFKVYVRDPKTGNVKKVNFGDKKMRIKKSNPKRRKSFRARHRCANPGPRTKARYWSCRKW